MNTSCLLRCWALAAAMAGAGIASSLIAADPSDDASLFDPNRLLQIELQLSPADWQDLRTGHRVRNEQVKFTDNPYEYYQADVTIDGVKMGSVGVRKKGFLGSVVSTRPSLKIKFDAYVKNQEFHGLDMMTLNNNNQDATRAQQLMSYNFFNAAGALAPRCNLARVIVNGEDLGIYTHVESIRKAFIKRHFKKANGDLYEGYAGEFNTNRFDRITHKWGNDDEKKHLLPLVDLLAQPVPVPVAEIEEHINLEGFITLWASEVLLAHWDGYSGNRNNWYAYRDRKTRKLHFIPWGADSVFEDPGPFINWPVPKSVKARGLLCRRLWESPEIRTRYRAEMQRILNEAWNEKILLARLDLAQSLGARYNPSNDPAAVTTAESIRKFIDGRRAEIQAELDAPAPNWPPNPYEMLESGPPTIMHVTGSFSAIMQRGLPEREPGQLMELALGIPFGEGNAQIQFKIGEKAYSPFTRYGVLAFPDSPMRIRKGYPSIQLHARSEDGSRVWNLTLTLDPHQIESGENDLPSDMFTVWSVLEQGKPGSPDGERRVFGVAGRVKLDEFDVKPGAKVSGTFELSTQAFREN